MTFLEWKESFNIGVKEIDNQHRGLFELVNKLTDTKLHYQDDQYFLATLQMFTEYAAMHFATEERYMQEAGYQKFDEHTQEHRQFLSHLSNLSLELEKNEPEIHQKILTFLREWYSSHILGTDRDYIESFQKKGLK